MHKELENTPINLTGLEPELLKTAIFAKLIFFYDHLLLPQNKLLLHIVSQSELPLLAVSELRN